MLHQLSLSIIIYIILDWLLSKLDRSKKQYYKDIFLFFLAVSIIIIGMIYLYPLYLHGDTKEVPLWASLFVTNRQGYKISPGDFFAVTPMLGFYILGALFGKCFYKERKTLTKIDEPVFVKPFSWLGKYSLQTYLIVPPLALVFFNILS